MRVLNQIELCRSLYGQTSAFLPSETGSHGG
jgi:hypothetical protein